MPLPRLAAPVALALCALLAACASLPPPEGVSATRAFSDTGATRLGRSVAPGLAAHPGETGIHSLPVPADAFAARVLLAHASEKSLDVQYFLWHGDEVGMLLLEALCEAARRGVRVRMLLDDFNTDGLDSLLAALGTEPNLEVRLYNPFVLRQARTLNLLSDFARLNRRMHNKSFTADNQVTIVGGRNIANEYFGAGSGLGFADLDVIAVGPAVRAVSEEFDLYWNSPSAYPAAAFVGAPGADAAARLQARFSSMRGDPVALAYLDAVRATPLVREIADGQLALEWASAKLVYDDPAKTLDAAARRDVLLFPDLLQAMGRPQRTLDLVSPYLVPGDAGTAALVALAQRGVTVRILTNSLAATDESAVHAGYARRRAELLSAGVELYELKPTATGELHERESRYGSSSSAALHAKTFAVDRERIFVGSFNFDPRSELVNTEMGLVVDSAPLAQRLAAAFDTEAPHTAYAVRLTAQGDLEWIEQTPSGEQRYRTEPATSWLLRRQVDLLSILPIESLL
jgi:putative cardiolipin synthase